MYRAPLTGAPLYTTHHYIPRPCNATPAGLSSNAIPTPFHRNWENWSFPAWRGMALLGSGGLELELDCSSIPRWNWNGVAWENFRIRRIGMAWRDSRKTFWDWHRIGQSEEQRRWRGVAWPFDTGEELEQNCSNPEQFSERERGVTARYANGLSTLFAKINETYMTYYMCESIPNFVDTHSR